MNLKELLALLQKKSGELDGLLKKEKLSKDELGTVKTLTTEIEELNEQVETLEAAEKAAALAAGRNVDPGKKQGGKKDPGAVGEGDEDDDKVEARPLKEISGEAQIGFIAVSMMRCQLAGMRGFKSMLKELDDNGLGELAAKVARENGVNSSSKSLNTMNMVQGGVLVPIDNSADFIDLLRPESIFLQGGPVRRPLPNGNMVTKGAASGASAEYRGEGARAIVSEPTFMDMAMFVKILSGIVPMTEQILRYSDVDIENWVRTDLTNAVGEKMDVALLRGDGTQNRPRGIMNDPAAVHTASTYIDFGTSGIRGLERDARALEDSMRITSLIRSNKLVWLMPEAVVSFLQDLRIGDNETRAFPEMQGENPTFRNKRVLSSPHMPSNLGVSGNKAQIALVDFNSVIFGEGVPLRFKVTDQASIYMNGEWVSLFQQGLVAIMADTEHDVAVRRMGAVQVLDDVVWQN